MADTAGTETFAASLGARLEKSKGLALAVCAMVFVIIVGVAVFAVLRAKSISDGIERIDAISYALMRGSGELSEDEISSRQQTALEELASLGGKSGIVGLRANMLIAEIKFARKSYEEARSAWLRAAGLNKKSYTAPLCYYNAAVCGENLNDLEGALACYRAASEDEDFLLIDHALFSLGRVNESVGNYEDAKTVYEKLNSLRPSSNWGQLAKSRLISLKAAGNIQ